MYTDYIHLFLITHTFIVLQYVNICTRVNILEQSTEWCYQGNI